MADESNTTAPAASSAGYRARFRRRSSGDRAGAAHLAIGPPGERSYGGDRRPPRPGGPGGPAGREGGRRVFPAQEGLQILRRKDRHHQLQRRADASAVRSRERQDRAAPSDGVCTPHQRHSPRPSSRPATLPCCRLPAARRKKSVIRPWSFVVRPKTEDQGPTTLRELFAWKSY